MDSGYISDKYVYEDTSLDATSQIFTRAKMYHVDMKYGCCMYIYFFFLFALLYIDCLSHIFPFIACLFIFFFFSFSLFLYCSSSFIIVLFDDTHL